MLKKEDRAYQQICRLAELALADLRNRITLTVGALGDSYLVRARLAEPRIKSRSSLSRKAQQKGWTFVEALSKSQDLVGLRLVCNNLQDVRRVADLLETALRDSGLKVKRDDYTQRPRRTGYRAIHLVFSLTVRMGNDEAQIGCEIQIRSLLQDSWAELSRADVYAGEAPIPKSTERRMLGLSNLLSRADEMADRIRVDLVKPRRGRRPEAGQPLSAPALAFLFKQYFREDAPEYVIQAVLREIEGSRIRADGIEAALRDKEFSDRLSLAYSKASDWEADSTQIFRWVVLSLVTGKAATVRRAAREGRIEWREITAIATREAMSGIGSPEEIIQSIERAQKDDDPESEIESLASALGTSRPCAFCGTRIIDAEELTEAVIKYFGIRGRRADSIRESLKDAVLSTAIETGSWEDSAVCSHCAHILTEE